MTHKFVIFWSAPPSTAHYVGDRQWETFDSYIEAMTALNSYATSYPWNSYHLARVSESRTKTVEKQPEQGKFTVIDTGQIGVIPPEDQ